MVEMAASILISYLIIILVVGGMGLTNLILRGVGLYQIGKREGHSNCFMAFIPYLNVYFRGEIAGTIVLRDKKIEHPGMWVLGISIIAGMVSGLLSSAIISVFGFGFGELFNQSAYSDYSFYPATGLGGLVIMLLILLLIVALMSTLIAGVSNALVVLMDYQIYSRFSGHNMSILHAVCGLVVPFYQAICFFVFRNKPYLNTKHLKQD